MVGASARARAHLGPCPKVLWPVHELKGDLRTHAGAQHLLVHLRYPDALSHVARVQDRLGS